MKEVNEKHVTFEGFIRLIAGLAVLAGFLVAVEPAAATTPDTTDDRVSIQEARATEYHETRGHVKHRIGPVFQRLRCRDDAHCTGVYRAYRPRYMWVVRFIRRWTDKTDKAVYPLRVRTWFWVHCPKACGVSR